MNKYIKSLLSIVICAILITCLSSCEIENTYNDGYDDGYNDGHADGQFYAENEFFNHSFEMYGEGYDEAYQDFEEIVNYHAVLYARKYSEWHPEEAMCIIACYEKGYAYCGELLITDEVYQDAIESLFHYYEYFYCAYYKQDAECDYDYYD